MKINFEKENKYILEAQKIELELEKHKELFDYEKLIEFKHITSSLKESIEIAEQDSRKLSIGIIGAVKAGKSSFLNACVFDGEEYLPKAATPMTAALTRITYSEKPKAIIHFYTEEDWEEIEKYSAMYQKDLEREYNRYVDSLNSKKINLKRPKSIKEFEQSYKCKSEAQKAAKELTSMIKDPTLLEKLGKKDEIEGDIFSKLNNYVGVNGTYTPIVNYVELQVNNPNLKDLEIVDTPGLNDPIVSRGVITKQFLRKCDVVSLLSRCSQFMDAETVRLMANNLPDAGVREILVIGSKLDSGILNEDTRNFAQACKKALYSYKSSFNKNLSQVKKEGKNLEVLNKLDPQKVLFISSICFNIVQKRKRNINLNNEEQKVYDNFHSYFDNFEDKFFSSLGGISKAREAFNEVLERKKEIIENKNKGLLPNVKINYLRILEKLHQETVSSRMKLETTSAEELKQKKSNIEDAIDSSREKLLYIFEKAIIKCDEKIQQLLPQLALEMNNHQNVSIKTTTHDKHSTSRVGLFGWKRETHYYTVTDNEADTSQVVNNIKQYSAKCSKFINTEFKNIFNKEEFAQKIKEVMLSAFSKSKKQFDEDEILLPVQNILDKISIPHITFDHTVYIDEIGARFKNGYAKNEEIHQLNNLQVSLLNKIELEITTQLKDALDNISTLLKEQAVSFADQIKKELSNETEKLQGQVEEREKYIVKYRDMAKELEAMKSKLSNM